MHHIFLDLIIKEAQQANRRLFQQGQPPFLAKLSEPYTPKWWDTIILHLGNWMINVGKKMKARSVYTKLSEKHI